MRKLFLILFLIVTASAYMYGQDSKSNLISLKESEIRAVDLLNQLEDQFSIEFRYRYEWIENVTFNIDVENASLDDFLTQQFSPYNITFLRKSPNYYILLKNSPTNFKLNAQKGKDSEEGVITLGTSDSRQSEVVLSGKITLEETGEHLPGVTVLSVENNVGTVSRSQGQYSLKLPVGYHTLKYQSVETGTYEVSVIINSSSTLDISLYKDFEQLDEVVVTAKALDENVSQTVTGVERFTLEEIDKMPAFLGESDVIKSITSLPGVSLTGEASAGFNVRGSGVGANLVLLDNGTLYNSSHLFGVFSAFSADNIESIELYKGAVPAKYGGRISSVLNIQMRSGSKTELKGNGGVGIISSRFNIETPVLKEKSSILAGFRAAYPNYLMQSLKNIQLKRSSTFFGDLSLKYDHSLNEKNNIQLTAYTSRDNFAIDEEVAYEYNNLSGSFEWNSNLSEVLSSSLNYNYSQYNYELDDFTEANRNFSLFSKIENNKINYDFEYYAIENHTLQFGLNGIYYSLEPGRFGQDTASIVNTVNLEQEDALEVAAYVSDNVKLSDALGVSLGVRYSYFQGGRAVFQSNYSGIEPRVSASFKLNATSSIKAGYSRMRQYIHLISNTASVTPVDLWKLSNSQIRPSIADQYSIGYFRNFERNNYETSFELYFRDITDLIEYRNGASLFANDNVEEELLQGKGVAYGAEFYVKKNRGRLTGWMSYTYSRSLISVDGEEIESTINNGDFFPTNFDQPHNLTLLANFELSRRFDISANFQYNTGRPITYPESTYQYLGVTVANYGDRNRYRIPDYHRLDLSFHMASSLKKNKNLEADWTLTLYNVYSRKNAYSVFFRSSSGLDRLESFRLAIIGQIVPAITYNFKF